VSDDVRREHPAPGEAGDGEQLSESASVAPSRPRGGQGSSASGGYGTGSDVQSSGGTGDATEDSSSTGEDDQTDWVREAPGGALER
jgi:hypothetical protein